MQAARCATPQPACSGAWRYVQRLVMRQVSASAGVVPALSCYLVCSSNSGQAEYSAIRHHTVCCAKQCAVCVLVRRLPMQCRLCCPPRTCATSQSHVCCQHLRASNLGCAEVGLHGPGATPAGGGASVRTVHLDSPQPGMVHTHRWFLSAARLTVSILAAHSLLVVCYTLVCHCKVLQL